MSDLIHAYQGRTRDYTVTISFSSGTLAADDVVRVKIGTRGSSPVLEIGSDEDSANGSSVTFSTGSTSCTVRIAQGDTEDLTGNIAYDMEIDVVDGAETSPADAIKFVESGVLFLHKTMGGEVGVDRSSSSSASSSNSSSS